MHPDDLNKPLGGYTGDGPQHGSRGVGGGVPWGKVALGGLGLLAAILVTFAWMTDDGMGGEPFAVARIETPETSVSQPSTSAAGAISAASSPAAQADSGGTASIGVLEARRFEAASGVKVIRQDGEDAPGSLIINVPQAVEVGLAPAPDPRLVERTEHGLAPKIGPDGARPMDVYARPVVIPGSIKPGAPRVAIVVGGMGLNASATADAITALPRSVTLGFAPYGDDLQGQVARARAAGHEALLQAPMEGFGAAEEAGPNVLRTADSRDVTLGKLRWHLSRFQGFVGVGGFLGAKFTADAAAFKPVLSDIAGRGLFYFEDGTSTRSLAARLAAQTGATFVQADVVIDARLDAMDEALTRLERVARTNGQAVGSATGLRVVVEKIARFAEALERKGVALVPVSSLARAPTASSADANQ